MSDNVDIALQWREWRNNQGPHAAQCTNEQCIMLMWCRLYQTRPHCHLMPALRPHLFMHIWEEALVAALPGHHALGVIIAQGQRRQGTAITPCYAAPPAHNRLCIGLRSAFASLICIQECMPTYSHFPHITPFDHNCIGRLRDAASPRYAVPPAGVPLGVALHIATTF